MILNGAARKNGHTSELVHAFTQGARSVGHDVCEFYLHDKKIAGCLGCHGAGHNPSSPCAQKDDMEDIYAAFRQSDVVVFASPVYFWTITGVLKTVADRLYAELECLGYKGFARESVLLTTNGGGSFDQITTWYRTYEKNLGWKNRGEVLGNGKIKEVHDLGASL